MKRIIPLIFSFLLLLTLSDHPYFGDDAQKEVTILFTHDVHDYFYPTKMATKQGIIEHGGAARLQTLLRQNDNGHSIYVDAGDFSMGTLLQAGFSTDALELRILGKLGCKVTTFGNHEFDYGAKGVSDMLLAAAASNEPLPKMVLSNVSFEGTLTDDQKMFQNACQSYGVLPYVIETVNDVKIGFFGVLGKDGISCSPTSGQVWEDYIEASKKTVNELQDKADLIVCLSHSGTSGDGKSGEDFDLAKKVPGIDIIISGHSHSAYHELASYENTLIVSAGEYLTNLGRLTVSLNNGKVSVVDYKLIPIDQTVEEDPDMAATISQYKDLINQTYLQTEEVTFDDVIAHSDFSFEALSNMYETHREYPMGDLIADSYLYEANSQGITDIDVALVGLGTIRGTFVAGDIKVSDVFEMCSLGVGKDGSAGHPIISCYLTGKDLKLLTELDASLGTLVSSIKMSYAGLSYTFNTKRVLLDRVTDVKLVRPDGTKEEIVDDKLYKVCCNLYAANMLGMLNDLTKGILSITPRDINGNVITNIPDQSLINLDGEEIKEWVALMNYLSSFEKNDNSLFPSIPDCYKDMQNRKIKVSKGGLCVLSNPGLTTCIVFGVPTVIFFIVLFVIIRKRRKKKA